MLLLTPNQFRVSCRLMLRVGDWAGAESELERAIELNPNYPAAHHIYSSYLLNIRGRSDEAIAAARRGLEIDPLSMPLNNFLVLNYQHSRRYDEAIEQLRRMLEIDPKDANTHYKLGDSYAAKGMYDEAFGEYLRGMTLAETPKELMEQYQHVYATSGWGGISERGRSMTSNRYWRSGIKGMREIS